MHKNAYLKEVRFKNKESELKLFFEIENRY